MSMFDEKNLIAVLKRAVESTRYEFVNLAGRYMGTPYEDDPAIKRLEKDYLNAQRALKEVELAVLVEHHANGENNTDSLEKQT